LALAFPAGFMPPLVFPQAGALRLAAAVGFPLRLSLSSPASSSFLGAPPRKIPRICQKKPKNRALKVLQAN